jgi:CubicO group peptidase (beta-lactamase class C family)
MRQRTRTLSLGIAIIVLLLAWPSMPQAAPDADFAEIDGFVRAQMARHRIPGLALAITHGDEVVHAAGFGTAGEARRVVPETPFRIASVSKPFTALAVMQLVEQGRVELDAPVQTYIPWFEVADAGASRAITVRHLLNQTSGLSEQTYFGDYGPDAGLEEVVRDLRHAEPVAPPGAAFHYFNQNYTVLGLLIELTSGQAYGDYVREHILEPLEMSRSAASLDGIAQLHLAQGHGMLFGFPVAREQVIAPHMMPSGGLVSTAEDMAHFLIAQSNGGVYHGARLLSARGVALSHQPNTPGAPAGEGYAMGWIAERRNGTRILRHDGSLDNFRAFAWLLTEQEYGVAVLINQNGIVPAILAYSDIPAGIADLLLGVQPETGLSMRAFYWILSALIVVVAGLDLRWWLVAFPRWRREAGSRSGAALAAGIAGSFARAALFYALPYLALILLGRALPWELGFTLAPAVMVLLWWNIVMGVAQGLAKGWAAWASRRQAGPDHGEHVRSTVADSAKLEGGPSR